MKTLGKHIFVGDRLEVGGELWDVSGLVEVEDGFSLATLKRHTRSARVRIYDEKFYRVEVLDSSRLFV